WDTAYLHIHYAASLEASHPEAAKMLGNANFDTDTISQMTYAVVVEKQDPAVFAKNWVANNGDAVDSWMN
ncbi:MAG: glycine betaine ABC transporter substrate-binding protein, partial [Candidatus Puniceispirillales bacterium]